MGYYEAPTLHVNYEFRENPAEWAKIPHLYHMKEDVELALKKEIYVEPETIAEAVFGRQKDEKSVSLKHLNNLLKERSRLHVKHMNDIRHRWTECQDLLGGARINRLTSDKRMSNLESRLVQLESEERKTELDFWRDTAELRKDLFEAKKEYSAVSNRELLFDSVEDNYDGSVQ